MKLHCIFSLSAVLLAIPSLFAAEAFEIGVGRESMLPGGKEADGIRGDFILRNDKVVAVISQNAPLRRANMSTLYGADGVTPGCLYDLSLVEENNDQLIHFGPAGQLGQVSWVRITPGSKEKKVAVEVVITADKSGSMFKRHEYRIHDGEQGIWIITTIRNEGAEPTKVSTKDAWTRFTDNGIRNGVYWFDAIDPADKCSYACGPVRMKGTQAVEELMELASKQEITWARFLAVGHSPVEALGIVQRMQGEQMGTLSATIIDAEGRGVPSARMIFQHGKSRLKAYPDANGQMSVSLSEGKHKAVIEDMGRPLQEFEITISADEKTSLQVVLEAVTRLRFEITDPDARPIPCKAQILAMEETLPLDLGPAMRAHGCKDQYHSENGHFPVQVPAGKYRVIVTHGIEFSHHEETVTLEQGREVVIKAALKRVVDTKGWISADFHNHSTPSGDNVCGTPDRIINIAAENIEFAPTTEHNRIYDWRPTIEKLGLLSEIQTIVGMELTGSAAHLNCFPLTVEPFTQDNGAPVWNADPRISALTLRGWQGEREDRWVQINHPDLAFLYNDRNSDGAADGGFSNLTAVVNGMECENGDRNDILADAPFRITHPKGALAAKIEYIRPFIWLQLLNQGHRITPLAVADAHSVHGNGVGGWRMYLPSRTDEPAQIDWTNDLAAHAKAGHIMLTTGPFLQVTANGKLPGDDVQARGGVELQIKVQCTDWQDIDRVQILVNGRKEPTLNFTRETHPKMFGDGVVKFDQRISVPLKSDAHLIVVATSETMDLKTGYGTSDQTRLRPMAYHTPIYVNVDGGPFHASGDTLGFEIPVLKMTPDIVRQKLGLPETGEAKSDQPAAAKKE